MRMQCAICSLSWFASSKRRTHPTISLSSRQATPPACSRAFSRLRWRLHYWKASLSWGRNAARPTKRASWNICEPRTRSVPSTISPPVSTRGPRASRHRSRLIYNNFRPRMPHTQSQMSRPGLLRQLGFFSATALVISNMVGTGIFATTGFMAGDLGSAALIIACWTAGALFAFAGALSYSELGVNFPSSGGEYVYLTQAFGPEWGFMTGWVSFFAGFSAPIAVTALAFTEYLSHFFPAIAQAHTPIVLGSGMFSLHLGPAQAVACGLIAVLTILNCLGVGLAAKVQNSLTTTNLCVLA